MSNIQIKVIVKTAPMLSRIGVLSAKKRCTEQSSLSKIMMSPINDITYPNQILVVERLKKANVNFVVVIG